MCTYYIHRGLPCEAGNNAEFGNLFLCSDHVNGQPRNNLGQALLTPLYKTIREHFKELDIQMACVMLLVYAPV